MEKLVNKIEEILEVEHLDTKKCFSDYDEWDSLAVLSLIAMLDSDYKLTMSTKELRSFKTIEEFCTFVLSK